ncbi:mCG146210, partial [Mus musculus]
VCVCVCVCVLVCVCVCVYTLTILFLAKHSMVDVQILSSDPPRGLRQAEPAFLCALGHFGEQQGKVRGSVNCPCLPAQHSGLQVKQASMPEPLCIPPHHLVLFLPDSQFHNLR